MSDPRPTYEPPSTMDPELQKIMEAPLALAKAQLDAAGWQLNEDEVFDILVLCQQFFEGLISKK